MTKVAVLVGSLRKESFSRKVARAQLLLRRHAAERLQPGQVVGRLEQHVEQLGEVAGGGRGGEQA